MAFTFLCALLDTHAWPALARSSRTQLIFLAFPVAMLEFLLVLLALECALCAPSEPDSRSSYDALSPLLVLNLTACTLQERIAAQVCAGLVNRNDSSLPPVYTIFSPVDLQWLLDISGISAPNISSLSSFFPLCLHGKSSPAKGFIRYNASEQRAVLPNIITLAAVLDAVPLEDGDPAIGNAALIFDALSSWKNYSDLNATEYMWKYFVNSTSGMAKMNPGYQNMSQHPLYPPLTGELDPGFIDYIVKERLFNFFLNQGCIPGTLAYELESQIVLNNPWQRPIVVYGYDNSIQVFGGDLF